MAEPLRQVVDVSLDALVTLPASTRCLGAALFRAEARDRFVRVLAHDPIGNVATLWIRHGRGFDPQRVRVATVALGELDAGALAYVRSADHDRRGASLWWLARIAGDAG